MSLIKYLTFRYRLLIYIVLSVAFGFLGAFLAHSFNAPSIIRLSIVAFILSYIMRIADDIHDFAKDHRARKKQHLTKKGLIILYFVLMALFIVLNYCFYDKIGLISIFLLGLIAIWEVFPLCKVLFLPLSCIIYVLLLGGEVPLRQYELWFYMIVLLFVSCGYYVYKEGGK